PLFMTTAPRLTVNLSAISKNWQVLEDKSGEAETAAVVKADAYGLGLEMIGPVLWETGCHTFFVAMVEEGLRLRRAVPGARIFVLNGIFADTVSTALEFDLAPVLSTQEQIGLWKTSAHGKPCAIHVDTGMNRLGLTLDDAETLADDPSALSASGATLVMSHLACADDPDHALNGLQLSRFQQISSLFSNLEKSLANSAAVLTNEAACFDLTRPGIAIYGGEAVNDFANPMEPVVRAESRILQIRSAKKGETIGYGASHILTRDSKIAICSIGYADGIHRSLSGSGVPLRNSRTGGGYGAIENNLVPMIGRVSMDLTAFDVTDVPETLLKQTSWIELFGRNILIDEIARACGTIGYELLTNLGRRYQREYTE
ncbi:MAG: alanine racemase, partial [Pseudomonadota bacterium]